MPTFRFGDVVYAPIPYADDLKYEEDHPAAVISSKAFNDARQDVVVMEITSRLHQARHFGAVEVKDYAASGLKKPSVIKPLIYSILQDDILRTLGHLDPETEAALKKALPQIFGFKLSPTSSSRRP